MSTASSVRQMTLPVWVEPRKPLKPRSLYVIFLVEKDVRVERRRRGHAWKRFHTQARHVTLHGSNAIRDMRAYAVTAYVL
jgi:hypothetical protein